MKFLIKWALNGLIVVMLLMSFTEVSFITAFITASLLTVIAYVIGDQMILRSTNNMMATISDFILSVVYLGLLSYFMRWDLSFGETLTISLILGLAEWVFHRYVLNYERSTA